MLLSKLASILLRIVRLLVDPGFCRSPTVSDVGVDIADANTEEVRNRFEDHSSPGVVTVWQRSLLESRMSYKVDGPRPPWVKVRKFVNIIEWAMCSIFD